MNILNELIIVVSKKYFPNISILVIVIVNISVYEHRYLYVMSLEKML